MILVFQLILFIWFLGCITSYRTDKWTLVDGMGIKSAEFIMMCMYVAGVVLYHTYNTVGKWVLMGVLILWIVIQFFCHWYYTIFGASERKLKGYYECFKGTARLFPVNEKRLVPDLYHIVLHVLLVVNLVMVCVK